MSHESSASPLPRKLGLHGDIVFTVRHAPAGFADALAAAGGTGEAVWQQSLLAPLDLVVAFHTRRDHLVADWPRLTAPLAPDGALWVAYPKPGSGSVSDLDAAAVRAAAGPDRWTDDKSCSIDDTWTALRFVRAPERVRPRERARRARGR
jgi:hypothetical protein